MQRVIDSVVTNLDSITTVCLRMQGQFMWYLRRGSTKDMFRFVYQRHVATLAACAGGFYAGVGLPDRGWEVDWGCPPGVVAERLAAFVYALIPLSAMQEVRVSRTIRLRATGLPHSYATTPRIGIADFLRRRRIHKAP